MHKYMDPAQLPLPEILAQTRGELELNIILLLIIIRESYCFISRMCTQYIIIKINEDFM